MFIVLPNQIDGLRVLEEKLDDTFLSEIDDDDLTFDEIEVAIPKFKIEASLEMSEILAKLGMGDMFDKDAADFSGISGKKDGLYVSKVFHKSFIEVNEEGSEAAAATAVTFVGYSYSPPPSPFVADRPFLYFIRDNVTKTILFIGRMAKPTTTQ